MWRDTEEEKEEQVGSKPVLDHREPEPQSPSECCLFNREERLGSCWAQFCLVELNLHYICCVPPCGIVLHRAKRALCIDFAFKVDFLARCAFKKFKGHLKSNETDFFI